MGHATERRSPHRVRVGASLVFCFAAGFAGWACAQQVAGAPPQGTVNVVSVVKVLTAKDTPAWAVAYEYDFPGRAAVRIAGLGTVPPKGSFRHLSNRADIEFSDAGTGAVLVKKPLAPTAVVAAKPPLNELPREEQFPAAFRTFPWKHPSSLQEAANTVLARYFRYLPNESNDTVFLTTTFAPLQAQSLPSGVLGRLALRFSFPHDPTFRRSQPRFLPPLPLRRQAFRRCFISRSVMRSEVASIWVTIRSS